MKSIRLGVLGSGSGTNLQAILDAIDSGHLHAEVRLVMSDVPHAKILSRAATRAIPTEVIDCGGHSCQFPLSSQAHVAKRMIESGVDLICLAGFMRLVKQPLLDAFPSRILNIHPSILPAFPGLRAWQQALDAGVHETGCTVHLVDAGMDTGPILMQARVPVLMDDTAESLHARIQQAEYRLFPAAITSYQRQKGAGGYGPGDSK